MILDFFLSYPIAQFFSIVRFLPPSVWFLFFIDPARSPSLGGVEFAIERMETIKKLLCVGKKLSARELNLIFIVSI
jgi:hypothetical protein